MGSNPIGSTTPAFSIAPAGSAEHAPNRLRTLPAAPVARKLRAPRLIGLGSWIAVSVACGLTLPILAVLTAFLRPSGLVWEHTFGVLVPRYLATTLQLGVGVVALAVLFGTGAAWLVSMCRFPGRRGLDILLVTPLALPAYVLAYVYLDLLGPAGPVQTAARSRLGGNLPLDVASVGGAAVVLAAALFPYVYILARGAFVQRSGTFYEISRSLGVGAWAGFWRISLPLARPAIVVGGALVLMETLADFGAVSLLGVQTFTTGIYRAWFSMGDPVAAARLGGLLLVGVFAILAVERRARAAASYAEARTRRAGAVFELKGWRAGAAFVFCLVPVLVGFVVPIFRLAWLAAQPEALRMVAQLGPLVANSVGIGLVTALLAVLLALMMAYVARQGRSRVGRWSVRAASVGYALPGPIIAVGVLVPLATLDGWIIDGAALFGLDLGLVLTGTVAALIYAYLVRFMTVGLGTVEAGLATVRPALDDAAASLGVGFARRLWRIHVPLAWPALASAFLLVAVDVIKELPVTLVLRPFDFNTLAVRTFDLARDERLAEAALPALVLVGLGLLPVVLLLRTLRARS